MNYNEQQNDISDDFHLNILWSLIAKTKKKKNLYFEKAKECYEKNVVDINHQGKVRYLVSSTTLMSASLIGDIDIVQYLIDKGADVNLKNSYGFTALSNAKSKGHEKIIKLLEDNGAKDINIDCAFFHTYITWTYIAQDRDFNLTKSKEYCKRCGDIDYRSPDGSTAIILASKFGLVDIVQFLIKNNSDLNLRDNNGQTALSFAKKRGYKKIIKLLEGNGAKE